jgi:hypothetical protein
VDNAVLAAKIGIEKIKMSVEAEKFASLLISKINQEERNALKLVNNKDHLYGSLMNIYYTIDSVEESVLPLKIRAHCDSISKIVRESIFNIDLTEAKDDRLTLGKSLLPGLSGADILKIIKGNSISKRISASMAKSGLSPSSVLSSALQRSDEALKKNIVSQYFARLRTAAYAIGRTSVSRIAGESTKKLYETIPRNLAGFQVHGILDDRIRPKHLQRNGTIYYKNPRYGNKGFDQMPNPPIEEDGKIAWNCRCWLSPIIASSPDKFYDSKGRIIPDPKTFSDWFVKADKQSQIAAVGARRYQKAIKRLKKGEKLEWFHLLDPDSGMLLDIDEVGAESYQKRTARIKKAKNIIFGP